MTHAFLFAPTDAQNALGDSFSRGVERLRTFKKISTFDSAISSLASIAVAPGVKSGEKRIHKSEDGLVWLADLGTWLPLPAEAGRDAVWLIQQYRQHGARGLARRLQGIFALLVVDLHSRRVHVVTDRCGSLHVFYRRMSDGVAVCTSSAALSTLGEAKLDPVGVHEFVATGIVYEDRSLWEGTHKVPPSSVLTLGAGGATFEPYWTFAEVAAETLTLDSAVDATHHGLVEVLRALPPSPQPLVSDLTGGYDSRFLLAGLLQTGRDFATTVSGPVGHPDVLVAAQIAARLGLKHQHVASEAAVTAEAFDAALRMTDGEYDAFDYARILRTHRHLSERHSMSINGSFGELARGYWWELLWPRLAKAEPLDANMVARRRFAAIGYDAAIFEQAAQLDLRRHMGEVAARATAQLSGFPNTTQMDCVYYTLRMQRWQGRIASSTNQLWPAFSPIGFSQVLDPILAARADTRFRSLLVRRMFARHAPTLASVPLEHGYPPTPATLVNLWRFFPLLQHYGDKVRSKVAARVNGTSRRVTCSIPFIDQRPEHTALFQETPLYEWLSSPMLLKTGLFRADTLLSFLSPQRAVSGGALDQWRRLVTLECLLRSLSAASQR